jgi:hypothetical protein
MWLDALGWTATAIFSSSYFFKQAAALRRIQAAAASLWVIYGMAIGSAPVVVANVIVAVAAIYASFRVAAKRKVLDKDRLLTLHPSPVPGHER